MSGTTPHGQGHATTFSQIVADRLGVEVDDVEFLSGDTAVVPTGMDTYGSRSLPVGGVALYHASERIVEKARLIAAHQLEVAEDDLEYEAGPLLGQGQPRPRDDVKETAFAAWAAHNLPDGMEPGLEATVRLRPAELLLALPAATSRSSRSTPRRAPSTSPATSRSTTSAT